MIILLECVNEKYTTIIPFPMLVYCMKGISANLLSNDKSKKNTLVRNFGQGNGRKKNWQNKAFTLN
jgi:hypothetical protein